MKVVSLFSGCGGSSMGYKLAGHEPVLAVEFIKEAWETYELNFPGVKVLKQDIRTIKGEDILREIGLKKYELDILDGSPPCASFSVNGNREKDWGKVKKYSNTEQRTDDLFDEYIRMVDEIRPKHFVAENVKGLAIGKAKFYLDQILLKLFNLGYKVDYKILDASDYGVPQVRERLIIRGIRNDVEGYIKWPEKNLDKISTKDAIGHLVNVESDLKMNVNSNRYKLMKLYFGPLTSQKDIEQICNHYNIKVFEQQFRRDKWEVPFYTIKQHKDRHIHPIKDRLLSANEAKILQSFPESYKFVENHTPVQNWERMGRAVPPLLMKAIAEVIC